MQTDLNGDFLNQEVEIKMNDVNKMELFEYTEDQAEELLFSNRKWLCGDLGLQLHTLRKVPNLLKVLRHHVNKDITIYPFINSSKELLFEQGSNNDKQDTWELSYRSICYILFHYGIGLESVVKEKVDVVVTVNPIDKLQEEIKNKHDVINTLETEIERLSDQLDDIKSDITILRNEYYVKNDELKELEKMLIKLTSLL